MLQSRLLLVAAAVVSPAILSVLIVGRSTAGQPPPPPAPDFAEIFALDQADAGEPGALEPMGKMQPGGTFTAVMYRFERNDGKQAPGEATSEYTRRLITINVGPDCQPRTTNELYELHSEGRRLYSATSADGTEVAEAGGATTTRPWNQTELLLADGRLCDQAPVAVIDWGAKLRKLSATSPVESALRGVPVQVYTLRQSLDPDTRRKFWDGLPGLRDAAGDVVEVIQFVAYNPVRNLVLATASTAITSDSGPIMFDAFELVGANCDPDCVE